MVIDTVTCPPISSTNHSLSVISANHIGLPGKAGGGLSQRHHGSLMGVNWRGAGGYVSLTHLIPLCVMCSEGWGWVGLVWGCIITRFGQTSRPEGGSNEFDGQSLHITT